MLKIVAKMLVKAEELEKFKGLAKELVQKSHAEKGNVFYSLNESTNNERELAFLECWKDQSAIDTHNATEHFKGILPKLAELCESASPVEVFREIEL